MPHVVIACLGTDRPGLVERLADLVKAHQGNWLESHLVHLGGQFAGVVRAEIATDRISALQDAAAALRQDGLSLIIHVEDSPPPRTPGRGASFQIVGQDRPGIIRQVSGILARHGANVEELDSRVESAPWTGEPMFHATVRVHLPEHAEVAAIRKELEAVADELMIDIHFDRPAA
jgi:glycine cleavage system regulatory protein